jgi:ABC-2 type transport system permease protein
VAETFRPYRVLIRAQLRSQLTYRASFLLELVSSTTIMAMDLVTVLVMFRVTKTLGSFDLPVSFLMASLAGLSFGAADFAVGNIEDLRVLIRNGQLDALLVRPLGLLGQLFATDFQMRRIGRIVQGVAAVLVGAAVAGVPWTWRSAALLVLTPVAGFGFFSAVFVIGATVAFWWIDSGEFANAFTYGGRDFTTYPVTVYGTVFRRLFAFGFGFAFVAYYPTLALLRKPDPLGLPGWTGWLSPVVSMLAMAVAALVWRIGVRHYRSTGS